MAPARNATRQVERRNRFMGLESESEAGEDVRVNSASRAERQRVLNRGRETGDGDRMGRRKGARQETEETSEWTTLPRGTALFGHRTSEYLIRVDSSDSRVNNFFN